MRLGLSCDLRHDILCTYCGCSINDHAPGCLFAEQKRLSDEIIYLTCPKCRAYKLTLSEADFWQCYACDTVLTSNGMAAPHDAELFLIDHWTFDDALWVRVIPDAPLRPARHAHLEEELKRVRKKIKKHKKKLKKRKKKRRK